MFVVLCADTNADPRQCTPGTSDICHPNATCVQVTPYVCACNPASSYRCECSQGYTGDGLTCAGELQLTTIRTDCKNAAQISTQLGGSD